MKRPYPETFDVHMEKILRPYRIAFGPRFEIVTIETGDEDEALGVSDSGGIT